ncbi:MAG: hypothetical protein ACI819_001642, partial [Neolewinella sp.]
RGSFILPAYLPTYSRAAADHVHHVRQQLSNLLTQKTTYYVPSSTKTNVE